VRRYNALSVLERGAVRVTWDVGNWLHQMRRSGRAGSPGGAKRRPDAERENLDLLAR
jgi:hypothetical protein